MGLLRDVNSSVKVQGDDCRGAAMENLDFQGMDGSAAPTAVLGLLRHSSSASCQISEHKNW